jgi:uncharacterized protein YfkK (UPF0435 family)
MNSVSLEMPTRENLEFLVKGIQSKLKAVNAGLLNPDDFSLDNYEELLDIYKMIEKKEGRLSMLEIEGVLEELRELRGK